ncbi:beta-agarase [Aquimarina sp. RZ0]|uniref:beta-agarase n=1 Tax=Aquimarina sp. RZ0 TaxID=2607730 RepID=UPI0011F147DB|nr:beta-agarase [Aquimarina sp. RZ0]KAA1245395.1 beta-agarase [Aquimarina sp. RZ0]
MKMKKRPKIFNVLLLLSLIVISCSSSDDSPPPITPDPDGTDNPAPEEDLTNGEGKDFKTILVPADPGEGFEWEFQDDFSDDFEYNFEGNTTQTNFGNDKWYNYYHANWTGPGPTIWRHENSIVQDGNLRLLTTRALGEMKQYDAFVNGTNTTFTDKATRLGCVTSTKRVLYPVYVEARVKIANAFIASDVWMLSPDDTQEIDILEAYGAQNTRNDQLWLSQRLHISHHVFIREPFQDYQPKDDSTWYFDPENTSGFWSDKWIRIGVYWKSPTDLEYYLNGKLIKVMDDLDNKNGKDGIDPLNYTSPTGNPEDRTGLSKEMDIILNTEVQNWNAALDRFPTDEEIDGSAEDHTMKIDWIRIMKPVEK